MRRFIEHRRLPAATGRAVLLTAVLALAGCGDIEFVQSYPSIDPSGEIVYSDQKKKETIFGEGGANLLDLGRTREEGRAGLGVNAFLWRATLDTIAFMPLTSTDIFGGVIITDWYTPPEAPAERFKLSVYIMGRELRADGVRVAVFRQRAGGNGAWIDTTIKAGTAINLENQILTRARQLRIASARVR